MSHRYPTRFQATFQAKQLQVALARDYQTRLQTKKIQAKQQRLAEEAAALEKIQAEQRRVAEEAVALEKTVLCIRDMMHQIDKAPIFLEKIEILLLMYQHLYNTPILLTKHERFRAAAWEKMNEQEVTLLAKLQTLPARLGKNNTFWHERSLIIQLLDQMEWVRAKYW